MTDFNEELVTYIKKLVEGYQESAGAIFITTVHYTPFQGNV